MGSRFAPQTWVLKYMFVNLVNAYWSRSAGSRKCEILFCTSDALRGTSVDFIIFFSVCGGIQPAKRHRVKNTLHVCQ